MLHSRYKGEYVAAIDFRFSGRSFKAGDSFPWRRLACSNHTMGSLLRRGWIQEAGAVEELVKEFVKPEAPKKPAAPKKAPAPKPKSEEPKKED